MWGKANEHNRKSKFYEAFLTLKEKQVRFPGELKFFGQGRRPSKLELAEASSKQSLRSISPPGNSADTIYTLMDKYNELRLQVKDELSKASKSSSYKIDVYKIMHRLNKFYDAFRLKFVKLSTDSDAF